MYSSQYKFHRKLYFICIGIIFIGIISLILFHCFDFTLLGQRSSCGLVTYFHIYCPGCGGTRAIEAFLHGNFIHSFLCHPIIIYWFLLFLAYFLPATYTFVLRRNGKIYYKFHTASLWIMLVIIVLNFVLRNILLIFFHVDYLQDCVSYYL